MGAGSRSQKPRARTKAGEEVELESYQLFASRALLTQAARDCEGLEETLTLTLTKLGLSPSLLRTFKSTNPIESMISVARTVTDNVKRWRNGAMILRWTAAGVLEAERQFRRVNGYRDLPLLRAALDRASPSTETTTATAVA